MLLKALMNTFARFFFGILMLVTCITTSNDAGAVVPHWLYHLYVLQRNKSE